jgi:hypothetical protein
MLKMLCRQPDQIDIPHVVIAPLKSIENFLATETLFCSGLLLWQLAEPD